MSDPRNTDERRADFSRLAGEVMTGPYFRATLAPDDLHGRALIDFLNARQAEREFLEDAFVPHMESEDELPPAAREIWDRAYATALSVPDTIDRVNGADFGNYYPAPDDEPGDDTAGEDLLMGFATGEDYAAE